MRTNHRQYERYEAKAPTFYAYLPELETLGRLVDISRGGISIEYVVFFHSVALEGRNDALYGEDKQNTVDRVVDIFSSEKSFRLSNIPCRLTYDKVVNLSQFSGTQTRRCGLQFGDLSEHQSKEIDRITAENPFLPTPE